MPLLWMTFDPEGSKLIVNFLSRAWIGLLFGAVGGAITGSAIASVLGAQGRTHWRGAVILFIFAGLFVTFSERKNELLLPFRPSRYDIWKGDVCLQTTNATCGPAALATCLHALGIPAKEAELALDAHTAGDGTLFADLARAAREYGVDAAFYEHKQASDVALPAIASVTAPGGMDHFVAVIMHDGKRCIGDPANGLRPLEHEDDHYQWSGMFLSLSWAQP